MIVDSRALSARTVVAVRYGGNTTSPEPLNDAQPGDLLLPSNRTLRARGSGTYAKPALSESDLLHRWEQRGLWRTMLLMWRLRWAYWRGVSAAELATYYR